MADQIGHPNVTLSGALDKNKNFLLFARIDEALSNITSSRVVFATRESGLELEKILGTALTIEMVTQKKNKRKFSGTVISAEYLGLAQGYDLFGLEMRTWLWFLTRTMDTRILQDMSTPDIVKKVCNDHGFSNVTLKLSATYKPREFTIQYDETDFDFISRLMEEDGMYYYFDYTGGVEAMVLADGLGAHQPIAENSSLEFMPQEEAARRHLDHIYGWSDRQRVVSGKVSLVDYEFTTPKTKLDAMAQLKKGKHPNNDLELYTMGGHYSKVADGETQARVRVERAAQDFERWYGIGNASTLAVGATFNLTKHERTAATTDFLIVNAVHHIQVDLNDPKVEDIAKILIATEELPDNYDLYRCDFEAMKKTDQFRPPRVTPWPDMTGLHTAVVTGPKGEEIYTDKYGRIKVQFHWDREGKNDDKTTCWIRVATPWAGKNWGMIHIPRIGQEVIVQFERGDPDHPICTGMLYNALNMPPWPLPDFMTRSGIKSDSSKGGNGHNIIGFEDKKGEEVIHIQAERDYELVVENNALIEIGLEVKKDGTLTEHVHGNVSETYDNNHTYLLAHNLEETITKGHFLTTIKEGDYEITLFKGHFLDTLEEGLKQTWLKKGDYTIFVDKGDMQTQLKDGDYSLLVDNGQVYVEASKQISLVCGSASIVMKSDGTIDIKGKDITLTGTGNIKNKATMNFEAEGSINAKVKGGVAGNFEGGATATLKGGIVNIN